MSLGERSLASRGGMSQTESLGDGRRGGRVSHRLLLDDNSCHSHANRLTGFWVGLLGIYVVDKRLERLHDL